jgi:hypothetical protein
MNDYTKYPTATRPVTMGVNGMVKLGTCWSVRDRRNEHRGRRDHVEKEF